MEKYILHPQGSAGVRRVRLGPGRGRVGPGQELDGEASGVGTVVGGELVGDGDERRDGNAGGMADAGGDGGVVNLYQRGRQGAARLLMLNHRTLLAASAADSGNVVMGVVVGDNVGNDKGSKVLGDVVVGAGGGALAIRSIPVQFPAHSCRIVVTTSDGTAPKLLRGRWPGPDTDFVVWLFQRFHGLETWGRDPCSPGPAP